MRKYLLLALMLTSAQVAAERIQLDDGRWVDEGGEIHDGKFTNEDIFAPWNDPLKEKDPFAPWSDPLLQDDPFAPWNDPISGEKETNRYLREIEETDGYYYWD